MGQRKPKQNTETKTKIWQIETACSIVSSSGNISNKSLDKNSMEILENRYKFAVAAKTIPPKIIISGYNRNCIIWSFRRSNEIIKQENSKVNTKGN